MKYFITGGGGYVGVPLVETLSNGDKVTVLDLFLMEKMFCLIAITSSKLKVI